MAVAFLSNNGDILVQTVLVANGASLSDELQVPYGMCVTRIITPASYDGGNISFKEAYASGGTFTDLYDCGDAATAVAKLIINTPSTSSRCFVVNPTLLVGGMGYLKIATASNVGADRTIQVVMQRTML